MPDIALRRIAADSPKKLAPAQVDLEAELEAWIERDPGLLQAGLVIVGRQVRVEGGPIDLLALDPLGRWVAVEITRGTLYRDAIAQALDYAASLASLTHSELDQKVDAYPAPRNTNVASLPSEHGPSSSWDSLLAEQGRPW